MILKYEYGGDETQPYNEFEYEITEDESYNAIITMLSAKIVGKAKVELDDYDKALIKGTVSLLVKELRYRDFDGIEDFNEVFKDELCDYFENEAISYKRECDAQDWEEKFM